MCVCVCVCVQECVNMCICTDIVPECVNRCLCGYLQMFICICFLFFLCNSAHWAPTEWSKWMTSNKECSSIKLFFHFKVFYLMTDSSQPEISMTCLTDSE